MSGLRAHRIGRQRERRSLPPEIVCSVETKRCACEPPCSAAEPRHPIFPDFMRRRHNFWCPVSGPGESGVVTSLTASLGRARFANGSARDSATEEGRPDRHRQRRAAGVGGLAAGCPHRHRAHDAYPRRELDCIRCARRVVSYAPAVRADDAFVPARGFGQQAVGRVVAEAARASGRHAPHASRVSRAHSRARGKRWACAQNPALPSGNGATEP